MSQQTFLLALFFALKTVVSFAQLDTIHWIPPMHARDEWGPQYLLLSTPETTPFSVTVRDGAGNLVKTAVISNAQPFQHLIGSDNNTETLVPASSLHKVLNGRGLVISGEKPFYAGFRTHANTERHAGDLTCKGRAALGQVFRIGHLVQAEDDNEKRSNFIGIMATMDSTTLSLTQYDSTTRFQINGTSQTLASPVTMTLNKGESVVFSQYIQSSAAQQPPNGFMGSLVVTSHPVAVNCGSWVGAPIQFMAHDIGIDQIVPLEFVGKEYVLCRGNGSEALEHPIVVAHYSLTEVYINGGSTPVTVIGPGDYYVVPTAFYSAAGNMYIRTSEPVYMYQTIGGTSIGDDQYRTAGLIFVPPLSCGIPNAVDNIFMPNHIGNMSFEGGMMMVAMRDSAVVVRVDGVPVPVGTPGTVPGNPDFVTYRLLKLFTQSSNPQTMSVVAEGAVQVALFGRNEPASFAGFFSGFTKIDEPTLSLVRVGDGVCPDTLFASGHFGGVQWAYEDSILFYGTDTMFVAYAPGLYSATGYLGICRRTDYAVDTVTASFQSPAFPFSFEEPSCFDFSDGKIAFGTPYGGIEPYQFSIDNGKTFSQDSIFEEVHAGLHKLVARDSTGCYNRPLELEIGQPDSFSVRISALSVPNPLFPGDLARYTALPERPVIRAEWVPNDSTGCEDCLDYSIRPQATVWVEVTVFDSAGCPASDRILVQVTPDVFVPNAIYPESDNGNDLFSLFSRDILRIQRLAVFDRWGELLFDRRDFESNHPEDGWDGRFRGKVVLPGVYVWLAEVEIVPGEVKVLKGDVTVLR